MLPLCQLTYHDLVLTSVPIPNSSYHAFFLSTIILSRLQRPRSVTYRFPFLVAYLAPIFYHRRSLMPPPFFHLILVCLPLFSVRIFPVSPNYPHPVYLRFVFCPPPQPFSPPVPPPCCFLKTCHSFLGCCSHPNIVKFSFVPCLHTALITITSITQSHNCIPVYMNTYLLLRSCTLYAHATGSCSHICIYSSDLYFRCARDWFPSAHSYILFRPCTLDVRATGS